MKESPTLALVISTVELEVDANRLARELVSESLAACVQIDGPIQSCYRWNDQVEHATEYRLMIKTTLTVWPTLKERLLKLHPYDEPEIIMVPIADASEGYGAWVVDQTT
ncbi:Divalent-cation tolerance protein CutA [Novipirellula galeiformis]|uniref:Divalent-cation tolerance protein CutA n=1 Tax=Novipirellula galeiformis TaxID=2528004 RepID=A0A5C6BW79_9BACT|nr:divalent-cation tolerance protein CutA [Novipirellula galeiformis]TWU14994.1 Divalent-cation tolerance protein CutA [Novipirellula galeiformis]